VNISFRTSDDHVDVSKTKSSEVGSFILCSLSFIQLLIFFAVQSLKQQPDMTKVVIFFGLFSKLN